MPPSLLPCQPGNSLCDAFRGAFHCIILQSLGIYPQLSLIPRLQGLWSAACLAVSAYKEGTWLFSGSLPCTRLARQGCPIQSGDRPAYNFRRRLHSTTCDIVMPSRATLGSSDHLDFELPFTSKLLLLAAYICSRNRPTLDRRLFDPSSRAGRRRSTMASDKQARPSVPCCCRAEAYCTSCCALDDCASMRPYQGCARTAAAAAWQTRANNGNCHRRSTA